MVICIFCKEETFPGGLQNLFHSSYRKDGRCPPPTNTEGHLLVFFSSPGSNFPDQRLGSIRFPVSIPPLQRKENHSTGISSCRKGYERTAPMSVLSSSLTLGQLIASGIQRIFPFCQHTDVFQFILIKHIIGKISRLDSSIVPALVSKILCQF